MPVVGDASVVVRAITDKVKDDIQKAFRDAMPAVQQAGRDHAKAYSDAFSGGLKSSLPNSVSSTLNSREVNSAASTSGKNSARAWSGSFKSELDKLDMSSIGKSIGHDLGDGVADGAASEIDSTGSKIEDAAQRSLGRAGRGGGSAFSRALNSEFSNAAQAASRSFTMIYAAGNVLGPAIAGIVSSISSLISGLYAMASAASVAGGALAVLPGSISVAAQAFGTLKLAFSGVSDALSAGMKAATDTVGTASSSTLSNAYAIIDAQKALGRARQDAADAAASSARQVADAERDVYDAEKNVLAVQKELNQARKEAAETLQQLGFDAEDAALAEQRAKLSLEDAYKQYLAVKDLPADDRTRQDAELSYKEAELAYREAKDRNNDLAKEQKKAAKTGIEGTSEVIDAQNKVNDAKKDLADRERSLADARLAQAKQRRDSAQAIADAEEALRRAHEQSAAAAAKGTTAANNYTTALNKLSPAAQEFVKYLISIRGAFDGLKAAAGSDLFPKLEAAIRPLITNVLPILETQLKDTGGLLGDIALGLSRAATSGEGLDRIRSILKNNNDMLEIFAKRGDDGRNSFDKLGIVIIRLLNAVQPLTNRFARWVSTLIDAADAATNTRGEMNSLRHFLDLAGDRAALLGDIFHNLWDIIVNVGKAADKSGEGLLKSFDKATKRLADFTGKKSTQDSLGKYFKNVSKNLRDIGDLVVVIGDEFLSLGDNRGVGRFAKSLIPAAKNLGDIGDALTDASPSLGKFLTQVTRVMKAFTDSGSLKVFLGILTRAAKGIADFAESPIGSKLVKWAGATAAWTRALSLLAIGALFVFKVLLGGPLRLVRIFTTLRGATTRMKKGLDTLRETGSISAAFGSMARASDDALDAFERQMVTDREKVTMLKLVEEQADKTALALLRVKEAGLPSAAAAGAPAQATAGRAVAGVADDVALAGTSAAAPAVAGITKTGTAAAKSAGPISRFGASLSRMSVALLGITGPVLAVVAALAALVVFFIALYKHSPEFKKFIDGIVDKIKDLGRWVGSVFTDFVFPAFDKFFGWVNDNLPAAGDAISKVFGEVVDFIGKYFVPVWATYFKIWWAIVKTAFNIVKGLVTNVLIPIFEHVVVPYFKIFIKVWTTYFKIIWTVIKTAFNIIKSYVTNILIPLFQNVVIPAIKLLWEMAKKYFGFIVARWKNVWTVVKAIWNNVIKPTFNLLRKAFSDVWNTVKQVAGWIADKFRWIGDKVQAFIDREKRGFAVLKGYFDDVWEKVKDTWDKVWGKLQDFYSKFVEFKNDIRGVVSDIKDFFGSIGSAVANIFTGLIGKVKGPLGDFIDFLNDHLIDNINKVTGKFGLDIPTIKKGFMAGGYTGPGPRSKVAGYVHADEHVIKSISRRKLERDHPGALEYMNKTGLIPASAVPMGDFGPFGAIAGAVSDKVKGAWDSIENLAEAGIGKVLERMISGAEGLMSGAGIKRGVFFNDFLYAIMDHFAKAAGRWGDDHQDEAQAKVAPQGGNYHVNDPGNPHALSVWKGGTFSNLFIAHLQAAEKLAGAAISVIQGGFRPATPYSGTSHQGDAIDLQVNYALLYALRRVGIAAGDRTGLGDWAPHIHAIPGPSAGYAAGSAIWQWLDYIAKGGMKQSARSPWGLAKGGVAIARPGGILANIAEAGHNERVEPLDNMGMSKRDRAMLDLLEKTASRGGGGDTYKIYPAAGMNEAELAQLVSRRVAWRRTVGT